MLVGFACGLILLWLLKTFPRDRSKQGIIKAQKTKARDLKPIIPEMASLPISCKELCDDGKIDEKQQEALTSPFMQTLVIAGAGAGKTKILTDRVVLLNKYLGIPISKILVLAFNNKAAQEVAERVGKRLNIPFDDLFKKNIRTIHSLALEVFKTTMPKMQIAKEEKDLRNIIKQILNEEKAGKGNPNYISNVIELFGDGNNKGLKYSDKKSTDPSRKIECSDGTKVRSIGEKNIVEALLKNKIKFEYEPLATWPDIYFQPDFYFPEYDVYAEYWGMLEHFDPIIRQQYVLHMESKKEQFKKYKMYLINLEPPSNNRPQKPEEYLVYHLKNRCTLRNTPGPNKKKMDNIFNVFEEQLIDLIISVINITLAYGQKIEEIIPKAEPYIQTVLKFIAPFCEKLEKQLELKSKTTFSHIMKGALDIFKNNPQLLAEYQTSYKYIFVDEVQDLQPLTRDFIRAIIGKEQALFAIGDDYQSIYSFAGSDPAFIVKFEYYFPDAQKIKLLYNYRCHPRIVDASNVIIRNNTVQDFKEVVGLYKTGQDKEEKVITILSLDDEEQQRESALKYVLSKVPTNETFKVLARYNQTNQTIKPYMDLLEEKVKKNECEFNTIHKSKGLEADNVLILGCVDHVNEKYCFPAGDKAQSIKDKILRLCRGPEFSLAEEETRLFYVAVTRAKKRAFIITVKGKESKFVSEKYLPRQMVNFVEFNLENKAEALAI